MSSTWDDDDDNSGGRQKVYSQSFNRGGGGNRGGRRNDDRKFEGNRWNGSSGGQEEKTMTIESTQVGLVLGRGGSNIRQLEEDSQCKISVSSVFETSCVFFSENFAF